MKEFFIPVSRYISFWRGMLVFVRFGEVFMQNFRECIAQIVYDLCKFTMWTRQISRYLYVLKLFIFVIFLIKVSGWAEMTWATDGNGTLPVPQLRFQTGLLMNPTTMVVMNIALLCRETLGISGSTTFAKQKRTSSARKQHFECNNVRTAYIIFWTCCINLRLD